MDILRGWIRRDNNDTIDIPTVGVWFRDMEPCYRTILAIALMFSLVVIFLAAIHLFCVLRYVSNEQVRCDLYWIVFMPPVISLCGSLGMVIPKAGLFLYSVALVYFMICLFVMVTLMTTLHGSRSAMCEKMRQHNVKLNIRVMPLGCCLFCFGKFEATDQNFRRFEWLVFQSPLVRIFLEVLNVVVFLEIGDRTHVFFQISNVIGIISLFIGSWGSYIIIPPGCKHLKSYRFLMLFRIVDLAQLAYSVQKFVLDFLAAVSIIENGPIIPDTAKAQFFTSFLLVCEMLFVSVLATILFRPSRTLFFDKYSSDTGRVGDATLCSAPVIEPHPLRIEEVSLSTDKIDKNHNSASTRSFYAGDFYSLVVRENRENSAGTVSTTASNESVDKKL